MAISKPAVKANMKQIAKTIGKHAIKIGLPIALKFIPKMITRNRKVIAVTDVLAIGTAGYAAIDYGFSAYKFVRGKVFEAQYEGQYAEIADGNGEKVLVPLARLRELVEESSSAGRSETREDLGLGFEAKNYEEQVQEGLV